MDHPNKTRHNGRRKETTTAAFTCTRGNATCMATATQACATDSSTPSATVRHPGMTPAKEPARCSLRSVPGAVLPEWPLPPKPAPLKRLPGVHPGHYTAMRHSPPRRHKPRRRRAQGSSTRYTWMNNLSGTTRVPQAHKIVRCTLFSTPTLQLFMENPSMPRERTTCPIQ